MTVGIGATEEVVVGGIVAVGIGKSAKSGMIILNEDEGKGEEEKDCSCGARNVEGNRREILIFVYITVVVIDTGATKAKQNLGKNREILEMKLQIPGFA